MTREKMKAIIEEQIELLADSNKESVKNNVNTEQVSQNVLTIMSAMDFLQKI